MATIKLTRVKCKNLTTNEDLFRLGVKNIGTISAEDVIKHAAEHSDVKIGTLRQAMAAITDSLTLFLSIGHGVQLGDLGSLQLSVNSKAEKEEKNLTVKNLTGVNVNLRPIGELKRNIRDFKFSVVGSTETTEDLENSEDSENPENNSNNGNNSNNSNNGNNSVNPDNTQTQEPVKYRITFKFSDNTEDDHEYEAGESINYPTNTSGYTWPDSKPTVMPAENVTVTEVVDEIPEGEDNF